MSPKKPSRLTPLERLINTSLGGLMKQREMVGRHGKKHHGLKVEDTVKLTHIRLAPTQGKVITATSLAKDLLVGRKEAEGGLQRLVKKGLVVAKEREGKEVYYESPEATRTRLSDRRYCRAVGAPGRAGPAGGETGCQARRPNSEGWIRQGRRCSQIDRVLKMRRKPPRSV